MTTSLSRFEAQRRYRILETYRRTEIQDPLHKWIGTYNIYRNTSNAVLQMALYS